MNITTQITMKVNSVQPIGIFNPVLDEPPGKNNRLWIAFVFAGLEKIGPGLEYELIPEDSDKKE